MPTKRQGPIHPIGAFRRKNKLLSDCAKPRKRLDFLFPRQNVLRISFSTHRILALFTQMKTPSLLVAFGHGHLGTPADQGERPMSAELAVLRRHGPRCVGGLVDLMLQATLVKTYERDF